MSGSDYCFLTCIQVSQETSKVVWYFHLFKNFSPFVVIHTVKGFSVVIEAEVDIFLEFSCFFYDPRDVGSLISGSSAFSTSKLYIWKFSVHILLKPSLKDFEHYLAYVWNEHCCAVVWTFFVIDCSMAGSSVMGFSRQEYWSGEPLLSPGDLPNPGVEPRSPAFQAACLPSELPGKPHSMECFMSLGVILEWGSC